METLLTSLQNQPTALDLFRLCCALLMGIIILACAGYQFVKFLFWIARNLGSHFQQRAKLSYHSSFKDRPNAGAKY